MSAESGSDWLAPSPKDKSVGKEQPVTKSEAEARSTKAKQLGVSAADIPTLGKAWVATNAVKLASLPANAVVAINVVTGDYVSASDSLTVMDIFEARFGMDAWAWVHHNDGPITVGGGLWALSSGA